MDRMNKHTLQIVGLALLAVVAIGLAIYAVLDSGQTGPIKLPPLFR
jgi:hypothetical protein